MLGRWWSFFGSPHCILRGFKILNVQMRHQTQCLSILKPGKVIGDDVVGARDVVDFGGNGGVESEVDGAD